MNRACPLIAALAFSFGCSDYNVQQKSDPATDRPEIQVSPQELLFGDLVLGEEADQVFTIASIGVQDLVIGDLRLSGGGAGAYSLTHSATGMTLAPGESTDVIVTYTPTNADDEALVLVGSNDPVAPDSIVQLLGAGVFPQLTLQPNPLDFGYTEPGNVLVDSIALVNTGGSALDISSVVSLGEGFTIDPVSAMTLDPGEEYVIDVTWAPTIEAIWSGELWVASNAANAVGGSTRGAMMGTTLQQPVAVCSVAPQEAFALYDEVTWIGRESYDPSGAEIVSWEWSLIAKPEGSSVGMPNGDADRSRFIADIIGTYTAELVVTNESGTSSAPCYAVLEVVPAQDLWVEMFWTHSGDDMDLHMQGPGGGALWSQDDCNWQNCVGRGLSWGESGTDDDPSLDIDDIPGTGPENINIMRPEEAAYQVYVHDYPGSVYSSSNDVTVNIYLSGDKVYTDTKAISGEDSMTHFATIDWPTRSVVGH